MICLSSTFWICHSIQVTFEYLTDPATCEQQQFIKWNIYMLSTCYYSTYKNLSILLTITLYLQDIFLIRWLFIKYTASLHENNQKYHKHS